MANGAALTRTVTFDNCTHPPQYSGRGNKSFNRLMECRSSEYDVAYRVLKDAYNAEEDKKNSQLADILGVRDSRLWNRGVAKFRRGSREQEAALKLEDLGYCLTVNTRRFAYVGITSRGADFWISDDPLPAKDYQQQIRTITR
jgi:hypothetical protein